MKLRQLHYFSGIFLTVFIGLHLFNHLCSVQGIVFYIQVTDTLRLFYRNIFVESLLLLAVLVQVFSGIKLLRQARKQQNLPKFKQLQIYTGLYLAFFLLVHCSAVLGGRVILGLDTNFYFGAATLNTFPHCLVFFPYYFLAIFSIFGHLAAVHSMKMKGDVLGLSPKKQAKIILAIGVVLSFVIFYGMTNRFQGVELPVEYQLPFAW